MNTPPKYGDFEAQRHWMELSNNLKIQTLYHESEKNDLQYWGLDYPPLTIYHSYIVGWIGTKIEPKWFSLFESRGLETNGLKLFMRGSVLLTDVFLYVPSILLAMNSLFASSSVHNEGLFLALIQPSLLLIDHGHFQYNHIMLAFTNLAIYFVVRKRLVLGSVFFCASIGFKQMALYYSPPFFFYILAVIFCKVKDKK
jgi:alpha-1,3-glucosyltransferase